MKNKPKEFTFSQGDIPPSPDNKKALSDIEQWKRDILSVDRVASGQEMMIKFVNGSSWKVVGSDNCNSLVGREMVNIWEEMGNCRGR